MEQGLHVGDAPPRKKWARTTVPKYQEAFDFARSRGGDWVVLEMDMTPSTLRSLASRIQRGETRGTFAGEFQCRVNANQLWLRLKESPVKEEEE